MLWVLILLGVLALIVVALVVLYNRLITLRNRAENAWAQVDVQLRRRYDLIPNLVETVKGYAAHERETFEAVTNARARAQAAQGPAEQGAAEGILGQALGRLFAVAEAYPSCRRTRTSASCRPSSPRPRTGSPSRARSTTTRCSRTTTRSRRCRGCSSPAPSGSRRRISSRSRKRRSGRPHACSSSGRAGGARVRRRRRREVVRPAAGGRRRPGRS